MTTDPQRLERDLAKFTDPATETKVTSGAHGTRFQFTRNGSPVDYFLTHGDGSIVARHEKNRKYASLRSLLASPEFADLRGFANTQARMFRDFDVDALIQPEGEFDGRRLALQTLQRYLAPQSHTDDKRLNVLLLDGPAGIGKTLLIQRFLVQRARAQQDINSAPPILHVTSRGRRLTALDEALAQSLQILRAQFTFDQVPALIRNNLIQLAIDGFDELVDPEGYRDAWFALKDFFDSTEFGGPIILAGRDTFFDQQSFGAQMRESRQDLSLKHVRLGSVSVTTAKTWLARQGWKDKDLGDPYTDLILRPGSYALRPYFLNELASAKGWKEVQSGDSTPRAYLVERFLEREAKLLEEKLSISADEVKERLEGLFEEIALEMADTETDAVDLSFLQMATEFAFGDQLNQADVAKLRHKSGSFALLVSDAREGFRRFPHTEISHHFLSQGLIRLIAEGSTVRFLRRGLVTSDLLAIFAEIFISKPTAIAEKFIRGLEALAAQQSTFDRQPENVAALLMTSLCRHLSTGSRAYSDIATSNVVFIGQIGSCALERIRIQRLDAEEASMTLVGFKDCEIVNLLVDETTRFGTSFPKVHRMSVKSERGIVKEIYDPSEISKWMEKHSELSAHAVKENANALRLLDRVCRIMMRQHMIKDHETDESGRVLRNSYWEAIEEILRDAGYVDRLTKRDMAGAQAPFVRMRDPYKVLVDRKEPQIAEIWRKVSALP